MYGRYYASCVTVNIQLISITYYTIFIITHKEPILVGNRDFKENGMIFNGKLN